MKKTSFTLSSFDGVAFDIDGTLSNSIPAHHKARFEAFTKMGFGYITREQHELGPTYGSTAPAVIGGILHAAGVINRSVPFDQNPIVQKLIAAKLERFEAVAAKGFEEQPGASGFVKQIAGIFPGKTAFVTASPERHVRPFMERYGLDEVIPNHLLIDEEVITVEGLGYKPLPDPYQLAKKRMQVTRLLVFEDNLAGVESAKRAGATVIAMGFDKHNAVLFTKASYPPDAVVAGYQEARELLGLDKV